jgi:hypothetical protein
MYDFWNMHFLNQIVYKLNILHWNTPHVIIFLWYVWLQDYVWEWSTAVWQESLKSDNQQEIYKTCAFIVII